MTGAIGLYGALFPAAWIGLFSSDAAVHEAGRSYLTRVAPFYVLFGVGMALNFATQGAGRMLAPFLVGVTRMLVATVGGYLAVRAGWGLDGVFTVVGLGIATFGGGLGLALWLKPWRARAAKPA